MTLLPKKEKKNKKEPEPILIATGQMHGKGPEHAVSTFILKYTYSETYIQRPRRGFAVLNNVIVSIKMCARECPLLT